METQQICSESLQMCREVHELVDKLGFTICVFGSVLEKGFVAARDLDIVIKEGNIHPKSLRILREFSKKYKKSLDVFIGPVLEEQWNRKLFFCGTRGGGVIRDDALCGKDFFYGLHKVAPTGKGE